MPINLSRARENLLRWLLPVVSLVIFTLVVWVIHRELAHAHLRDVLQHFRAIPWQNIGAAALCTAISYWLLGLYDLLGLRYVGKRVRTATALFTAFIASAFGHNLGLAAFTGAAVRYRIYGAQGLNAVDVATVTGFCSITSGIGLLVLAGVSLVSAPHLAGKLLHLHSHLSLGLGVLLLAVVIAYAVWSFTGRTALEIRGWAMRAPRPTIALPQIAVAVVDLGLSAAVLWLLLPPSLSVDFLAFAGVYAIAIVAGILSHVPGGLGVFESVVLVAFPAVPAEQMLGTLLAWRLV